MLLDWPEAPRTRLGEQGGLVEPLMEGELIRFLVSSAAYRGILIPGWGESPRYLMPATSEMYSDPALLQAAPLHGELLPLLEKGVTVSRPGLNATLREVGRKLDEELLPAAP